MKYKHVFCLKLMQIWGLLGLHFYLERFWFGKSNSFRREQKKKDKIICV